MKPIILLTIIIVVLTSCKSNKKQTYWDYNSKENGGFEMVFTPMNFPPDMVYVPGGTVEIDSNKTVTINGFLIGQHEETNHQWKEYLQYLKQMYPEYPEIYRKSMPDTNVWREEFGENYNDDFFTDYFISPAFDFYPVVGVSWMQATAYCDWKTDRVNEKILLDQKILSKEILKKYPFNTEAFTAGQYEGCNKKEDHFNKLTPRYQLPTLAEWLYAYRVNEQKYEDFKVNKNNNLEHIKASLKKIQRGKNKNKLKNFKSIYTETNFFPEKSEILPYSGNITQKKIELKPVIYGVPNQFGLYNMNNNVSELVRDVFTNEESNKNGKRLRYIAGKSWKNSNDIQVIEEDKSQASCGFRTSMLHL